MRRRLGLPLLILLGAVAIAFYLMRTSPSAERTPRPRQARLVQVEKVAASSRTATVQAFGTVQPAREIVLRPQVGGRIVAVDPDFAPGGRFARGETLLRVDPSDYELAVRQRESELAQALADLRVERGNQVVAEREFALLGETLDEQDRDLVLRGPQLETVRARVAGARAALAAARLDLERTVLTAPFDALMRSRAVELGAQVEPGAELATLVATDAYWIEVSVPVDQLRWIRFPGGEGAPGSPVRVYDEAAWGPGVHREGEVVRLLGDLESEGRMARVLIVVRDPLGTDAAAGIADADTDGVADAPPRLLLGAYLRTEIEGRNLADVIALDRELLREGDRVWLLDDQGRLEIRPVTVGFRASDRVLVTAGLRAGERVVRSDLSAPVAGMPLRTQAEVGAEPAPELRDGS